jgi:hypothetical protein
MLASGPDQRGHFNNNPKNQLSQSAGEQKTIFFFTIQIAPKKPAWLRHLPGNSDTMSD